MAIPTYHPLRSKLELTGLAFVSCCLPSCSHVLHEDVPSFKLGVASVLLAIAWLLYCRYRLLRPVGEKLPAPSHYEAVYLRGGSELVYNSLFNRLKLLNLAIHSHKGGREPRVHATGLAPSGELPELERLGWECLSGQSWKQWTRALRPELRELQAGVLRKGWILPLTNWWSIHAIGFLGCAVIPALLQRKHGVLVLIFLTVLYSAIFSKLVRLNIRANAFLKTQRKHWQGAKAIAKTRKASEPRKSKARGPNRDIFADTNFGFSSQNTTLHDSSIHHDNIDHNMDAYRFGESSDYSSPNNYSLSDSDSSSSDSSSSDSDSGGSSSCDGGE
jgi:hypothetical protein